VTTLVTGGGGFLGGGIVSALLGRGRAVRSFSRGAYPELAARGVEVLRGDLTDAAAVSRACKGCEVVFHVAARPGIWGPRRAFEATNIQGTVNVLAACREHGVPRLVYTSSPSVVFDGRDQEGVDESAPYPRRHAAHYPRTKAAAEALVLQASDAHLRTVSLRPHLIWGPGDNHLVPRILARGRAGQLRRLGHTSRLIDSVYIDNAVDAHLAAAERLEAGAPVAGRVYFITNGEPWPLWDLVNGILAAGGLPPVERSVPLPLARMAAHLLEGAHVVLRLPGEPRLTRFLVEELSTAHWFDITAARQDLGYEPRVSIAEGLQRLARSLTTG
jgi:nucleoside-diphosphate-sugar epimerase